MPSVELGVPDGASDGHERADNTLLDTTNVGLYVQANTSGTTGRYDALVRFDPTADDFPPGSTITACTLTLLHTDHSKANDLACTVYGNNVDSCADLTSDADVTNRARTSASAAWTATDVANHTAIPNCPDLSTILQEIIDRQGYSAGNPVGFLLVGSSSTVVDIWCHAYEQTGYNEPRLNVTWTTGGTVDAPVGDPRGRSTQHPNYRT